MSAAGLGSPAHPARLPVRIAFVVSFALGCLVESCAPLGTANSLGVNNPSARLRTNEIKAVFAMVVTGDKAHGHATFFDAIGASVELTGGDRVFCNGIELLQESATRPISYDSDVPVVAATSAYRFELRRSSGEIAAVDTDTPTRITVSAPLSGTQIKLGQPVTVVWSPAVGGVANVLIKVAVVEGPCTPRIEDAPDFPDNGSATLDGSMFSADGAGACTLDLVVTRGRSRSVGAPFASGGLFLSMEDAVRVVASP